MKNKIGFNLLFAVIAFPIIIALVFDFDAKDVTFKKPALDIIYAITLVVLIYLTFKKIKKQLKIIIDIIAD